LRTERCKGTAVAVGAWKTYGRADVEKAEVCGSDVLARSRNLVGILLVDHGPRIGTGDAKYATYDARNVRINDTDFLAATERSDGTSSVRTKTWDVAQ